MAKGLIHIEQKQKEIYTPKSQDGKFNIIYADPPWQYGDSHNLGGAGKIYDLMSMEDLYNLPVKDITADDAVCFMWVTYPFLQEGLNLFNAWGFQYKTIGFQWIKTTKNGKLFWGCGNWTRANSEPCLIGVKGKPKAKVHNIHQVIMEPMTKHSEKPKIIRDKIVELCGDLPRVELFARTPAPGWHVWGNEINSDNIFNNQ